MMVSRRVNYEAKHDLSEGTLASVRAAAMRRVALGWVFTVWMEAQ